MAVWVARHWSVVWPLLVAVLVAGVVGGAGWALLRAHRRAVGQDRAWREQEEARVRELSMAEVDALSWQEFEAYVADLCRRDGCTKVVVSGKSGDLGADVIGYLSDGRKLVIQCKKYAPHRSVGSQDMQKFVGTARLEHGADVALFVTTSRTFTKAALGLAQRQDIMALHRDLLGSWVKGAHLETLLPLNGSGGGTWRRPSA
ncbi:restriction endonuclease [Streptomyces flaveolus]|uniref:restriction endonuclease n=1 Tax=Streptomyces flaveolus TaxID=67297 RepID=UPI003702CB08